MSPLKKSARDNLNFNRACNNFVHRCAKIRVQYGAKIYVILEREGKYQEYTSTIDEIGLSRYLLLGDLFKMKTSMGHTTLYNYKHYAISISINAKQTLMVIAKIC